MKNKTVQQNIYTEPKDNPQEAFRFAGAYEEGISHQKKFERAKEVKNEPLYANSERDEDNVVLHARCWRKSTVSHETQNQQSTVVAITDSVSSVTKFTKSDLRELLKVDVSFARPMPKQKQYVDYNNKPLNLLKFTTVNVNVGKNIKNARIVFTRDGNRSLFARELVQLQSGRSEREK